ncbi:hypothetical protein [Kitasatospora acidiphila]|uniref:hypothetical protein n=1 Tax=Kitasatospora acidiphila TaxID=2567942 RepID=UPI0015F09C9C|nr:hypothetical protein [Kitasatospora acidiphila]
MFGVGVAVVCAEGTAVGAEVDIEGLGEIPGQFSSFFTTYSFTVKSFTDGEPAAGACPQTFQLLFMITMRGDVSPAFTSWKVTSLAIYASGFCKASFALSPCIPTTLGTGVPVVAGLQPAAKSTAASAATPNPTFLPAELGNRWLLSVRSVLTKDEGTVI